jgi:hypothetical protein
VGSNLAEDERLLRVMKVSSTTYFGEEVKLSAPCCKIYGMLKNPTSMKELLHRKNSALISCQVSLASLLDVSASY